MRDHLNSCILICLQLSFLAKVPALGLATFTVKSAEDNPCTISTVQYYNNNQGTPTDK